MAHGPVIVGNGGLINKSPYQTNQVQRDNRRGIPAELHDEVIATREFKKRRTKDVKCTSEAFKRAMCKEADQEANDVIRAAARMGVGQHQYYVDVKAPDCVPERWAQKLISRFYDELAQKGAI